MKPRFAPDLSRLDERIAHLESRVEHWADEMTAKLRDLTTALEGSLLASDECRRASSSRSGGFIFEIDNNEMAGKRSSQNSRQELIDSLHEAEAAVSSAGLGAIRVAAPVPLPEQVGEDAPLSSSAPASEAGGATSPRSSRRASPSRVQTEAIRERLAAHKGGTRRFSVEGADLSIAIFCPPVAKIVMHPSFDFLAGIAIVFNAFIIGAQVQYESQHLKSFWLFSAAEVLCVALFTLELLLRAVAFGPNFVAVHTLLWAILDTVLVVVGILDVILSVFENGDQSRTGEATRIMNMLRMIRIVRVVRMLRLLGELRTMVSMVAHSMLSLFWLLLFMSVVIYVFAIIFTKGATDMFIEEPDMRSSSLGINLTDFYGSLFWTMYTLFRTITGGVTWGESADPLFDVGYMYVILYLLFICFTVLCVLNLVTGILVDGAIELAKRDRSIMVDKENKAREAVANHLIELLEQIDNDGSGTISREEFSTALESQAVVSFIEALDIDTSEAMSFYDMLDFDGDNSVSIEEWMEGMKKLKGEAKSADLQRFRLEVRRMLLPMSRALANLIQLLPEEQRGSQSVTTSRSGLGGPVDCSLLFRTPRMQKSVV